MKYGDAVAFRQALEDRLKTNAQRDPIRLARSRKRVAFDRLLSRLVSVAPDRWLLKGGFALDLRMADRARATKDVDIEWRAAANDLYEALIHATEYDAGDFFVFTIERTEAPADQLGGSQRFRVAVSLAGRPFEGFLLDVGFADDHEITTETLVTDDLLEFAGIPPTEVKVVPIELQVAEKLHAYTRTYEGGRGSTRTKDLVDLALIAALSKVDAARLRVSIERTFRRRETHPVPAELPAPPASWAPQFRQLAEAVGVEGDLTVGHRAAAQMIDPLLAGTVTSGTWDPEAKDWTGR